MLEYLWHSVHMLKLCPHASCWPVQLALHAAWLWEHALDTKLLRAAVSLATDVAVVLHASALSSLSPSAFPSHLLHACPCSWAHTACWLTDEVIWVWGPFIVLSPLLAANLAAKCRWSSRCSERWPMGIRAAASKSASPNSESVRAPFMYHSAPWWHFDHNLPLHMFDCLCSLCTQDHFEDLVGMVQVINIVSNANGGAAPAAQAASKTQGRPAAAIARWYTCQLIQ